MFEQPADFLAESTALHRLLADRDASTLAQPTRFKRWTIDEILRHLHVWNQAAALSLTDEPAFLAMMARLRAVREQGGHLRDFEAQQTGGLAGPALRSAWYAGCEATAQAFAPADPKRRLKWAGPDMSARSSISARLMETWAHAQAIWDRLGVERQDGDRIRNIVTLGVNTFGWTFAVHRQDPPAAPPHLRLRAPSGALWTWHEASETDLIEGSATEFCQVVTQVRNIADTRLRVRGEAATRWMAIAQCFAGGPEQPPAPGTRFRESLPG